ncbi:MAG: helix-turn-helix domain-containing protein [Candidatus Staskawiczbacteria bacterium]|nr:helix-turn-helix domain-containing protein [Candidatus Staskawiczbacteria bacterium]
MVYYAILILVIAGMGVWVWYLLKQKAESEKEVLALSKEKDELASFGSGLEEYNKKMQEKKEQAKAKIMELLARKEKISNSEAVKNLSISSSSAVRYLDELEREGKVKQVGKTGKSVVYSKV